MDMNREDAIRLLEWYAAMGVDEAIAEEPADWFAFTGDAALPEFDSGLSIVPDAAPAATGDVARDFARPRTLVSPPPRRADPRGTVEAPARGPVAAPPAIKLAPGADARELARSARSLDELQSLLAAFDGCPLKKTAKNLCFARGAPDARLMLIGEAPGRDEDIEGVPFVGRAGQLLDRMLAAIGMSEADAYITNVVFWRPPGNRTPTPQETQACQPFLERQIELVNPEVLVFLGGAAAKQLLNTTDGIMKLRGKWLEYRSGDRVFKSMATLHPAYLLRTPVAKRLAWRDLLLIQDALKGTSS